MADSEDDRTLSIIPYNSNREIVLRYNDAVVVFDRSSQQLQLETVSQTPDAELQLPRLCPYCHRPFGDGEESEVDDEVRGRFTPSGYVDPNYFALLHSNQLASTPRRVGPTTFGNRLGPYVADERDEDTVHTASNHLEAAGISPDAFNDGFFQRNFIEERLLGKGGKGVVMLVRHMLGSNDLGYFACKRIPVGDSPEWLRKVLVEVQTLKTLSHHNLAPYHHAWLEHAKVSNFGPTVPCVFILQRYCEAGDLHRYVCGSVEAELSPQQLKARMRRKSRGESEPPPGVKKLPIDMIYSFFKDINNGLRYLHKKGLIHRDLKPSNCLLTMEGNKLRAVVSDFGEVQPQDSVRASTGNTGTVSYCAPEVLRRVSPNGPYGNFTFKSDIFSLGMILYFLCFATLPYVNADVVNEDNEDLDKLREEICHWPGFNETQRLRPELPDQVYWLLARLLAIDPDKRPSAKEIFEFMKNRHSSDIVSPDRRPSLSASLERPGVSVARSERGTSIRSHGSISPTSRNGQANRSPEVQGTVSNGAIMDREYSSTRAASGQPSDDHTSLVVSRKLRLSSYPVNDAERNHQSHAGYQSDFLPEYTRVRPRERYQQEYPSEGSNELDQEPATHSSLLGRRSDRGRLLSTKGTIYDSMQVQANETDRRHSSRTSSREGHEQSPENMHLLLPVPPVRRSLLTRRFLTIPFTRSCLRLFCAHPVLADFVAFTVFFLKILSITIPCSTHATKPAIFYPLLILATVDFGVTSAAFHVFASICHILAIAFVGGLDGLCVGL
ncbi:hypothetical protein VTO42DRAFT_1283 [Malbranchea cinnamomea]